MAEQMRDEVRGSDAHFWEVHALPVPLTTEGQRWLDFVDAVQLHNDNTAAAYGTDDASLTALESWPEYTDPAKAIRVFVVRDARQIVALGTYDSESASGSVTAWLHVDVHPGWRRRGVGTAMAARLTELATVEGATKAIVYAAAAELPGDRITAATGVGSVPRGGAGTRFLLNQGFELQQVRRGSRLQLPYEPPRSTAMEYRSPLAGYRLHFWGTRTPECWREDMSGLRQRMSTEAPTAGLQEPEDVWTVQRLVDSEIRLASGPREFHTAAVEHRATNRLVGFTTLAIPSEVSRPINQEDTIVLPEHRGHRLGALLKLANLDRVQQRRPGHPSVVTFNAEDNRSMLKINEAIGFKAFGYEGAWRCDLT